MEGAERVVIGLVPCAVGGTAIREWEKESRLYDEMVRRAKEAAESGGGGEIQAVLWYQGESDTASEHLADTYKSRMERLIRDVRCDLQSPSLPFIQASPSTRGNSPHLFAFGKLGWAGPNFVSLDVKASPFMSPVDVLSGLHAVVLTNCSHDANNKICHSLQVAIASGDKHRIEKVREAQLGIDMPNVMCVDARGLPLNEDHLHLSTEAQVLLGNMLAQAYIKHFLTPHN